MKIKLKNSGSKDAALFTLSIVCNLVLNHEFKLIKSIKMLLKLAVALVLTSSLGDKRFLMELNVSSHIYGKFSGCFEEGRKADQLV